MFFTKVSLVLSSVALLMGLFSDFAFLSISRMLGGLGIFASTRTWIISFAVAWIIAFILGWELAKAFGFLSFVYPKK